MDLALQVSGDGVVVPRGRPQRAGLWRALLRQGTGIERFYRDVRTARIYEGTSQIHLLNIAKRLLR